MDNPKKMQIVVSDAMFNDLLQFTKEDHLNNYADEVRLLIHQRRRKSALLHECIEEVRESIEPMIDVAVYKATESFFRSPLFGKMLEKVVHQYFMETDNISGGLDDEPSNLIN